MVFFGCVGFLFGWLSFVWVGCFFLSGLFFVVLCPYIGVSVLVRVVVIILCF